MALVRSLENDEYSPEYSTLLRVDVHTGQFEQLPTVPSGGHGAMAVAPLLRR